MPNNPYISFVVPCYNAYSFLEHAIKSILMQPYENWEVMLVNDGSTDETEQVCLRYSSTDTRIHYIKTTNRGAGHARNIGVQKSHGTWIVFLDADDLLLSGSFTTCLIDSLVEYEDNTDVIYTSVVRASDMNLREEVHFYRPEKLETIKYRPNMAFWNGIYRKKFLIEKNIRFFEYQEQDVETAFRYIVFERTDRKVVRSDISFYLQRNNSLSNTHTWDYIKLYYVKALIYSQLLECFHDAANRDYLYEDVVEMVYSFYRRCVLFEKAEIKRIKRINHVFYKAIRDKECKCVTRKGKRHFYTNFLLFVCANASCISRPNRIEQTKSCEIIIDATDLIMSRLKYVSRYVHGCLSGDVRESY